MPKYPRFGNVIRELNSHVEAHHAATILGYEDANSERSAELLKEWTDAINLLKEHDG